MKNKIYVWCLILIGVLFSSGTIRADASKTTSTGLASQTASALVFPPEPQWYERVVTKDDVTIATREGVPVLEYIFGKELAENVFRFNRRASSTVVVGTKLRVPLLPNGVQYTPMPSVLPGADGYVHLVVVDKSRQFVGLYENGRLVISHPVSTARRGYLTPTGKFKVLGKFKVVFSCLWPTRDGRCVPMPWAMGIRGAAFWLHGGSLPGEPASHGCIRQRPDLAKLLYDHVEKGADVMIVGKMENIGQLL